MTCHKPSFVTIFVVILLFSGSKLPAQTSHAIVATSGDGSRVEKTTQESISDIGSLTPGQKLSDEFVLKYLGLNPNVPILGYNKWYFDQSLPSPTRNVLFIIVKTEWPEGIGKVLYSFTVLGEKIGALNIYSENNADAGESAPTYSYAILDDSVIEVREIRQIYFKNTLTGMDVKYYDLRKDGKFIPIDGYINHIARRYPELSTWKLSIQALKNKSREELRLMRNEIFAAHGFIFKAEDAKRYFKSQKWYSPQYSDVSDRLTPIEKNNVDLILDFEKNVKQ